MSKTQCQEVRLDVECLIYRFVLDSAYSTGAGKKNAVVVVAMAFRPQMLMPAILRSDLDAVREVLSQLNEMIGMLTSQCYFKSFLFKKINSFHF